MSLLTRTVTGPVKKRSRQRNPLWRFRRFFFLFGVLGLVGVAYVLYDFNKTELSEDPFGEIAQTSYVCTSEVADLCNQENSAAQLSAGQNREVVPYAEIPDQTIETILAAEDRRFFEHNGIDAKSLTRAAVQIAKRNSTQGGSTITQQYVKIALLENDERSLSRKSDEAMQAIQLEQEMEKEEIFERYANTVYFGRGAYGIQAASRAYFGVDIDELTLAESAFLPTLIRRPARGDDVVKKLDEAAAKRAAVLDIMFAEGWATEAEVQEAKDDEWPRLIPFEESAKGLGEVKGSEVGSEYFLETVRRELERLYPEGEYYTNGLRVYTTLDLNKQAQAYETVNEKLDLSNPELPAAAVVTIDEQGQIEAMFGGKDFANEKFNLATNGIDSGNGRQPGSTMKPIAMAEAIEQGISAKSLYKTQAGDLIIPKADNGGDWEVKGRGAGHKGTFLDVVEGLERSSNQVFAQLVVDIEPENLVERSQKLGITKDLEAFPSLILGGGEVSPIHMASAFSTFEREGQYLAPVTIKKIEDADGNVVCWYPLNGKCEAVDRPEYERVPTEAMGADTAQQVNYAMQGVVDRSHGTGKNARIKDRKVAGKTGTTTSGIDGWFVGFSCDVTTAVWVGRVDNKPVDGLSGGKMPAQIWSDYMTKATAEDPPCKELPTSKDFTGTVRNKELAIPKLAPCPEWIYQQQNFDPNNGGMTPGVDCQDTGGQPQQPNPNQPNQPNQPPIPGQPGPSITFPGNPNNPNDTRTIPRPRPRPNDPRNPRNPQGPIIINPRDDDDDDRFER